MVGPVSIRLFGGRFKRRRVLRGSTTSFLAVHFLIRRVPPSTSKLYGRGYKYRGVRHRYGKGPFSFYMPVSHRGANSRHAMGNSTAVPSLGSFT